MGERIGKKKKSKICGLKLRWFNRTEKEAGKIYKAVMPSDAKTLLEQGTLTGFPSSFPPAYPLPLLSQGMEYPSGPAPSQLLVQLLTARARGTHQPLTEGEPCSATTKPSLCYRCPSRPESKPQQCTSYRDEN